MFVCQGRHTNSLLQRSDNYCSKARSRWQMYEAFPKVISMSEVVVSGDMDVWGGLGPCPGRGRAPDDRAGPPALPPGFPLQDYHQKRLPPGCFITKLPPAPFTWTDGGGVSCYIEGSRAISGSFGRLAISAIRINQSTVVGPRPGGGQEVVTTRKVQLPLFSRVYVIGL